MCWVSVGLKDHKSPCFWGSLILEGTHLCKKHVRPTFDAQNPELYPLIWWISLISGSMLCWYHPRLLVEFAFNLRLPQAPPFLSAARRRHCSWQITVWMASMRCLPTCRPCAHRWGILWWVKCCSDTILDPSFYMPLIKDINRYTVYTWHYNMYIKTWGPSNPAWCCGAGAGGGHDRGRIRSSSRHSSSDTTTSFSTASSSTNSQ